MNESERSRERKRAIIKADERNKGGIKASQLMSDEKWTDGRLCLCTHGYVCVRECDDSAVRLRGAQLRTRCSRHRGLNLPHSLLKLQPQFLISIVNLITYRSRDTHTLMCYIYLHATLNCVYFSLLSLFPPLHTTLWLFRFLPSVMHIHGDH